MHDPTQHIGRPPRRPNYDSEEILRSLIDAVAYDYLHPEGEEFTDRNGHTKMKVLTAKFGLSNLKIRKLLITAGVFKQLNSRKDPETGQALDFDCAKEIQSRKAAGSTIDAIMEELHLSRASVYSYLPYEWDTKQESPAYHAEGGSTDAEEGGTDAGEESNDAERLRAYCERAAAVEALKERATEENLWQAIIAFQNYPFKTASGLPFRYTLKAGRRGELTRELWIDRRENSKSLAWSSVKLAFWNGLKLDVAERPKALGDIRGVSYIYPILWRLGVIEVPEKFAGKMETAQTEIR